MITIHKYQFELGNHIEIEMPCGSQILCVQEQNDKWVMWAMVNTEQPVIKRSFKGYWTGEELPDMFLTHLYIATVQDLYVWHIFEVINVAPTTEGITNMNIDPKESAEEVKNQEEAAPAEATQESAEEGTTEG
jgi:hypothetical protein